MLRLRCLTGPWVSGCPESVTVEGYFLGCRGVRFRPQVLGDGA